MESRHFSHAHPLVFHRGGSEMHCSGCKQLSPAGIAYACWKCNYFLHEQCFRAARSLNHPAHPAHPLTLVPYPTYPSTSFFCNTCNLGGTGFCYCCSECDFDVHVHCAAHMLSGAPSSSHAVPNHGHAYNNNTQNSIYPPPPIFQNHLFP